MEKNEGSDTPVFNLGVLHLVLVYENRVSPGNPILKTWVSELSDPSSRGWVGTAGWPGWAGPVRLARLGWAGWPAWLSQAGWPGELAWPGLLAGCLACVAGLAGVLRWPGGLVSGLRQA